MLRTVRAVRYVCPLREGGSLPALVEADDDGLYVVKLRGAGQGPKALVAEVIAGEIGRALGLPVPEIVLVDLDPSIGANEPDAEVQQLLLASGGLNVGLDYLPGAMAFEPASRASVDRSLAARVVWFDAFTTNVDRTAKNPNILLWHRDPWLIDHGAALYFHHSWDGFLERARAPFPQVRDHVLLARASSIIAADAPSRGALAESKLREIVAAVPGEWLLPGPADADADATRSAYVRYFAARLESSHVFVEEAERARTGGL